MATQILYRIIPKPVTLASFFSRSISTTTASASLYSVTRSPLSSLSFLHRLRPVAAVSADFHRFLPSVSTRNLATRATSSSLNDPNPNWSNRPPKETILLDGCDFEHWLVVMEKPEGDPTRDEIIDSYIKTLAQVVGSEEEARMKIYSVSTRHYYAFGALVSEELSYKIKELPRVRWVLPDSYLDVKNKDYGGEPFINGQAVPYDPKYHEEWVRNNARANERNRRNDRPRNADRSRNFERRRENIVNRDMPPMPNQAMQQSSSNMGGPRNYPPNNMGGAPPSHMSGVPPNNMGGAPPSHMGGVPPNMGGAPPSHMGGFPPNMGGAPPNQMGGVPPNMSRVPPHSGYNNIPPNTQGGGVPPNNYTGMTHNNMGGMPPPNQSMGGMQPPNQSMGGMQPPNQSMGGMPPPNQSMGGMQPPNQSMGGMPPPPPNQNMGGMPPNAGWPNNVPGRDH